MKKECIGNFLWRFLRYNFLEHFSTDFRAFESGPNTQLYSDTRAQ